MPASTLNDTTRLSVLRALAILDTPAEPAYDDSIVQRLADTTYSRGSSLGLREPLRLSVGAVLAEDDETVAAVLHRADAAMYRAKSAFRQSAATSSS